MGISIIVIYEYKIERQKRRKEIRRRGIMKKLTATQIKLAIALEHMAKKKGEGSK